MSIYITCYKYYIKINNYIKTFFSFFSSLRTIGSFNYDKLFSTKNNQYDDCDNINNADNDIDNDDKDKLISNKQSNYLFFPML